MSWATARAQLITILEDDVSGLDADRGLPNVLQHNPRATEEDRGHFRTFSIEHVAGASKSLDNQAARRRFRDVDLRVYYDAFPDDPAFLDELVGVDADAIADALLDESNWDRSTSLIVNVGPGAGTGTTDELIPYDITTNEDGSRDLVLRVAITHR